MDALRRDFPLLVNHPELVYFDSAATSLKPQCVVDAVSRYYTHLGTNIHRGDYPQALETTQRFEAVRHKVAHFIHCHLDEVVFTQGTSSALNLVAFGFLEKKLSKGDKILLNYGEHASNILPWFEIAKKREAQIEYIPLDEMYHFDFFAYEKLLKSGVRAVSVAHISNVLGTVQDLKRIIELAHQYGAYVIVDGAQAVGHHAIDVHTLDADFYAFSSHKMFGPAGVGVLYGKKEHLLETTPLNYGGDSNARIYIDGTFTLKDVPTRFETGTPNIEGILGFGAAIDYIQTLDLTKAHQHVLGLHTQLVTGLEALDNVVVHNAHAHSGIVTFNIAGIFSQDVAAYLGHHNICVRAGSHCSKLSPYIFGEEDTVRASLHIYNTCEEVDRFLEVLKTITLERVVALYV